jgi:hypothetical protein
LLTDLVRLIFSSAVITDYDYVFSENGLVAHKNGELIGTQVSFRAHYAHCLVQREHAEFTENVT